MIIIDNLMRASAVHKYVMKSKQKTKNKTNIHDSLYITYLYHLEKQAM